MKVVGMEVVEMGWKGRKNGVRLIKLKVRRYEYEGYLWAQCVVVLRWFMIWKYIG